MTVAGRWAWLGYAAGACFVVATVTYAATALGLAGPTVPEYAGDLPGYQGAYLAYRRDGFGYDQVANWTLAAALIALGLLGEVMHQTAGFADRLTSRLTARLLTAGGVVTAVTQVAYLGAIDQILFVSGLPGADPGPLAAVVDAVERTDDYVENLGQILIGFGLVSLARLARAGGRATGRCCASPWPRE
jgi:hypothetical protein